MPVHVPPSVVAEVRDHVAWTRHDLERRARHQPSSVEPDEVGYVDRLGRWDERLRPPYVRRVKALTAAELAEAAAFMELGTLDPGESEVLAVAARRGWVAVIDDLAAHCRAEEMGLPHVGTLGLLVGAVEAGRLAHDEAAVLWQDIQTWWDYAPPGALDEYLVDQRPLWPRCP